MLHDEIEFRFDNQAEYEKELAEMIRKGETLSIQGTEAYDELLDEYLKFCEENG